MDTVGRDTERIRRYIQEQEAEDQRLDQLELPPCQTKNADQPKLTNKKPAALSGSPLQASGSAGGP